MKKRKILLIDADMISHILVSETLKDKDIEITHVQSGREAIDLFKCDSLFDLIITELVLPDMDGLSVINEIRKFSPSIPVIVQTAYALSEIKYQCIQEGINDFIEKPIILRQLFSFIRKYIPEFVL